MNVNIKISNWEDEYKNMYEYYLVNDYRPRTVHDKREEHENMKQEDLMISNDF